MKAKDILKYLFIAFFAILWGGCSSPEVESKFDSTPTERLNARKKELNDLLLSSENGWKLVYYTDNTQLGGWTHLFKFLPDGKVDMASDYDADTDKHRSQYEIQTGSTISLVFTTANRIHLLSESDNYPTSALEGKGYLGDFQFFYYGQENGEIIFRTNRNFQEIRFVKATAKDWDDLVLHTPIIESLSGNITTPLFKSFEINDGTKIHQFDFDYNTNARFGVATSLEPGSTEIYNIALSFTPTGAISNPAVVVKGQNLTNFIYDVATNNFIATGTGGVTATIKFVNEPNIITDDFKILLPLNSNVVYGHDRSILYAAPTNSPLFISLFESVEESLPAGYKMSRVQPWFNTPNGSYIEYRLVSSTGAITRVYHFFNLTVDTQKGIIKLNATTNWRSGSTFANATPIAPPAFLKDLDDQLTNPAGLYFKKEDFTVGAGNTVFTFTGVSGPFRMTTWAFQ
ncbi:DUF4302 domain-containing protein [Flavobacterium sp. RS13.1]|uniref:DUF4302 domain-containing protein n=1 Tax=Flavobacterium sp. RS13.1 TaxID=3400345 RepID=UPI003AAD8E8B